MTSFDQDDLDRRGHGRLADRPSVHTPPRPERMMRIGIGERRNQRALPALVIACNSSFNAKEESGGEHKESGLRRSPLSFWEAEGGGPITWPWATREPL